MSCGHLSCGQDQSGCGNTGSGGDDDALGIRHLVHGGSAQLADCFGDPVHAVDVGLTELAAVGVEREPTTHFQRTRFANDG